MTSMEKAVSHSMTASLTMPTFRVTVNAASDALIKAAKKPRRVGDGGHRQGLRAGHARSIRT